MKAISLWQPWASAVAVGVKRFETRHWATNYRGPIAIHAARKRSVDLENTFNRIMTAAGCRHPFEQARLFSFSILPKGAVVAVAELGAIWTTEAALEDGKINSLEMRLGNYGPQRFVWFLINVRPLRQPYFIRGRQALFNVPDSIVEEAA